jgi:sulfatase maturation enzyme AslB (radical SAM superfamily)
MCHPTVSSSLAAEYQSNQPLYEPFFGKIEISKKKWHEDSEFEKFIDQIYNIDTLILTGGEPLINPRVIKLLQTLPLANINLIVTTNATQISPLVFDLLNQAKTTGIIVSLEGVGAHNDYLRFGSKWIDIDLNIKKLSQLDSNQTIPVTINHVLQHTSIYSLPQVIDYAMINQHEINIHKLTFPPWLDLASVPMEKRQWAINFLAQQIKSVHQARYPGSFKSWLESAMIDLNNTPYNPELSEQFVKYIDAIDQTRQTNFQTTFGQLP